MGSGLTGKGLPTSFPVTTSILMFKGANNLSGHLSVMGTTWNGEDSDHVTLHP